MRVAPCLASGQFVGGENTAQRWLLEVCQGGVPVLGHRPGLAEVPNFHDRRVGFVDRRHDRQVPAVQAVAVVVADTRYIAEDAAPLVEVDYESLPVVSNCRKATDPESPTVHRHAADNIVSRLTTEYGDVEPAFVEAAHIFGFSLKQHRGGAHSIEGRGVVANYDADSHHLTIWTSTQSPHKSRDAAVELFDMDESRVRVIVPDVGGGFGGNAQLFLRLFVQRVPSRLVDHHPEDRG